MIGQTGRTRFCEKDTHKKYTKRQYNFSRTDRDLEKSRRAFHSHAELRYPQSAPCIARKKFI